MIKPEQLPDAVLNAADKSIPEVDMEDYSQYWSETLRVAIAAALSAWPGAAVCHYTIADDEGYEMVLPLPFPQETRDE